MYRKTDAHNTAAKDIAAISTFTMPEFGIPYPDEVEIPLLYFVHTMDKELREISGVEKIKDLIPFVPLPEKEKYRTDIFLLFYGIDSKKIIEKYAHGRTNKKLFKFSLKEHGRLTQKEVAVLFMVKEDTVISICDDMRSRLQAVVPMCLKYYYN